MPREEHPSDAAIEAFVQGRLALAEASRLEEHLGTCDACGEKLGRVGVDTYSELIRERDAIAPTEHGDAAVGDLSAALAGHGRYTIVRPLGAGGMGIVYEAEHRVMRRRVAIKVIRPDLLATPAAVSRFRREVHAAASLSHPNIVTAFDAEEAGGVHLFVMEYVPGATLEQRVHDHGPFPWREACAVARLISLGLAHAHGHGMIHRDVKPANIMVTPEGTVKILDFGLAAWSTDAGSLTQAGIRLGTPSYAAPEQFPSTQPADARADQYGLGATLHFLLTGRPPGAASPFPADVPPPVRAIVATLLAADPSKRFASADAAAEALAPWAADGPPKRLVGRRAFAIVAGVSLVAIGAAIWVNARPRVAGGSVLFLLPSRGLWFEDYAPARKALEDAGHHVLVATPDGGPSRLHESSRLGKTARPVSVPADLVLADVQPDQFDAVVCVGADHAEFTTDGTPSSDAAMRLLRQADRADKWIVGVCAGQHVVGAAGLLLGKRVARASEYFDNPAGMGGIPQPAAVVLDGRILTASTSADSAPAAAQLIAAMNSRR